MLEGRSGKEGEELKMPVGGSPNWVAERIPGLRTEKGGAVEEGEADITNLVSCVEFMALPEQMG